ncbi:MAG: carboxypeptidase [Betaproteobacteria bacterium]|nr:carboxypeptidase [Betaproteobacteria bacterium]
MSLDRYLDYPKLTAALESLAARHPDLFRIESIGTSFEGREIWLVTATNRTTGEACDKPAFWVDGNIHATELAGSMACLHFLESLARRYGEDADVTRVLDTRAFHVCPRLNPDGAEWALAKRPRLVRSSTRPYPYDEEPVGGLRREDVDGDGRVLTMRIVDPNGPWKASDRDPRLLVRREPTEAGGTYYRLLPEGFVDDFDGHMIEMQARREQLDLNRNYPAGWRQEHEQHGAGPFPVSEPEVRAAVAFITAHPNITGGIAFHTYSGVLLRPCSHRADETLPVEDLRTFQKIGAKGTEITGYPNVSVFHEFRYHPKEVITGSFDDWLYEHLGLYSWTVEIWSPQREAGIEGYKFIDWYREHPEEDDLKLLAWNDSVLGGEGFVPWYPFEHPQFGHVELGGWNALYTWSNPPPALLEREVARFPDWIVWHALISPRLEFLSVDVQAVGEGVCRLTVVVHNTGWLPTYVSKRALENRQCRGVIAEISLPDTATLLTGARRVELGQLEGRAYKPSSPSAWSGWGGDVTQDRAKFEWVVEAARGTVLGLVVRHDRAGVVRREVTLA